MNDKQKLFVIIGSLALVFWLFLPTDKYITIIDDLILDWDFHYWFATWYQTLSFAIAVGCAIGFFLFKNKK
jgi:hypothetical protein|tara:strand:+ start:34 stop:246 length:213 start_codon:yes stop_codon:yes gene_type:complete